MIVEGVASNALIAQQFSKSATKSLDLTECMGALTSAVEAIRRGDLRGPEALLAAQSVSLNTMFARLALVALDNTSNLDASERLMRLAFKAQSQCRATVETLAAIKNPPTVFARQANIANGPQQVNNGFPPPPRAGIQESRRNELLEEACGERLELGAASTAGASDPALATVGPLDRPTNGSG